MQRPAKNNYGTALAESGSEPDIDWRRVRTACRPGNHKCGKFSLTPVLSRSLRSSLPFCALTVALREMYPMPAGITNIHHKQNCLVDLTACYSTGTSTIASRVGLTLLKYFLFSLLQLPSLTSVHEPYCRYCGRFRSISNIKLMGATSTLLVSSHLPFRL